jgi:hypothetical protein
LASPFSLSFSIFIASFRYFQPLPLADIIDTIDAAAATPLLPPRPNTLAFTAIELAIFASARPFELRHARHFAIFTPLLTLYSITPLRHSRCFHCAAFLFDSRLLPAAFGFHFH